MVGRGKSWKESRRLNGRRERERREDQRGRRASFKYLGGEGKKGQRARKRRRRSALVRVSGERERRRQSSRGADNVMQAPFAPNRKAE